VYALCRVRVVPCTGKLGTSYSVIGAAPELLLWRRPLHQAVQAYVDGAACYVYTVACRHVYVYVYVYVHVYVYTVACLYRRMSRL